MRALGELAGLAPWTLLVALGLAVGCAKDEPDPVSAGSGACTSFTSVSRSGEQRDTTVWYRPDGLEELRIEEHVDLEGTWWSSITTERGYLDGRLLSETRTVASSAELAGPEVSLTTYAYDDHGRLHTEELRWDGVLWQVATHRYDGLGQRVETYTEWLDWQEDWQALYTWEDGRLLRFESRRVDLEGPSFVDAYTYLEPAPSLDAEVYRWASGQESRVRRRYDGEDLVEEVSLDGPDPITGLDTYQWVWRDDGQLSLSRSIGLDERWLEAYSYDADGHLLSLSKGDDTDGDDVIDVLAVEQTWTWSCE